MVVAAGNRPARRGVWIAAGVAVLALALLLYRSRGATFDWKEFFRTFAHVNGWWIAASVALILFTYFGRALRWEVMLRPLLSKASLWNLTSATIIGFTAVVLLGRPGELARPYLIAVKERVAFSSQMAIWFLERILDLLMVLLIFGIALARLPPGLHVKPPLDWVLRIGGYVLASIVAVCIVLLVVFRSYPGPAQRRILSAATFLPSSVQVRIEKALTAFIQGMECTRSARSLLLIAGYTLLEWVSIVAVNVAIFKAIPAVSGLSLDDVLIFLGFVAFGSVVQIPGIGGGVQLAAIVVLTQILKVDKEFAAGVAILYWLLSWVAVVPFGLALALHEGLNWKKIRHLQEEAPPL